MRPLRGDYNIIAMFGPITKERWKRERDKPSCWAGLSLSLSLFQHIGERLAVFVAVSAQVICTTCHRQPVGHFNLLILMFRVSFGCCNLQLDVRCVEGNTTKEESERDGNNTFDLVACSHQSLASECHAQSDNHRRKKASFLNCAL